MRKVSSGLFISIDGVAEAPNEWQFDVFNEEMGQELGAFIGSTDTILLGRVTYDEWVGYWPNVTEGPDVGFADFINNTPKYVVSNTLDNVDAWQNSTLVRGDDLLKTIADLKQQPGKNIGVTGSPSLVDSLLQADLLDELILMVHPVVVNKGKHLFKDGGSLKRLKLVDSRSTSTGVVFLTYHRPEAK